MDPKRVLLLLACLCAGCPTYVGQPVQPVTLVAVAQRQKIKVTTQADVLLVIDDSPSMSGKQARLASAVQAFAESLDALAPPIDYRVAVVSTSVAERFGACAPAGDPVAALGCDSDWGARGFVCDDRLACLRTFPAQAGVLHPPAAGAPAVLARKDAPSAQAFAAQLVAAAQVGSDGARQPQGLRALELAIGNPSNGLLRDGAKLVLAVFSDADDCSDPDRNISALVRDPATGVVTDLCAAEIAGRTGTVGLMPVARTVKLLRELKNADGTPKEIQVGAVVSLAAGSRDPGLCADASCESACGAPAAVQACADGCQGSADPATCAADCVAQCKSFCDGQVPGRRYATLAISFGGVLGSVCGPDPASGLAQLARVLGIPAEVALYATPEDESLLQVTVEREGHVADCEPGTGFALVQTAEGPAVRFLGNCRLRPDDIWDVRYLARP